MHENFTAVNHSYITATQPIAAAFS